MRHIIALLFFIVSSLFFSAHAVQEYNIEIHQLSLPNTSAPARKPQWLKYNGVIICAWETPVAINKNEGNDRYSNIRYGIYIGKGNNRNEPIKSNILTMQTTSRYKYPYYKFFKMQRDISLIDSYCDGTELRRGIDVSIHPIRIDTDNNIIERNINEYLLPPRSNNGRTVKEGYCQMSYIEPVFCDVGGKNNMLFVDPRLEYGGIFVAKDVDVNGWKQCRMLIEHGRLPDVTTIDDTMIVCGLSYDASVNIPLGGAYEEGWFDDFFESGANRIPAYGQLRIMRVTNDDKISDDAIVVKTNDVTHASICTGNDGIVYIVYSTGIGNLTTLNLISSIDKGETWSDPIKLVDGKSLDREPCVICDNDVIYVAYSHSDNKKTAIIMCAEIRKVK